MGNIIKMPTDADSYYKIASKKMQKEAYADAIPYLKKAMALRQDVDYTEELVTCYAASGEFEKAELMLFERILQNNSSAPYFKFLSSLYTDAREPSKAFLYGFYYVQMTGDDEYMDELTETFDVVYQSKEAVEKESALFVAQQIFQYLFSNGRIHESIEWLDNQPLHLQEKREMRNLKAMAYLFISKYNEAEILLEQLLTEDETDIHALCHYALLLYNLHDRRYDYYLKRLKKLHPINEDESFKLGIVLSFLKQHEASQELLLPLYKKQLRSAQLLHAVSFNYYALGEEELSMRIWQELQDLAGVSSPSPKVIADGLSYIERRIEPLLGSDDHHERLLAIFYLSQIEDKEMMISKEMWEEFEQLADYEKLYLSYIFHQLELTKLDFIHRGLLLLKDEDEALLLRWIDTGEALVKKNKQLDLQSCVAATYYLYMKSKGRISKATCAKRFDVSVYKLNLALGHFKQIDI